jgi:hypothetical protein
VQWREFRALEAAVRPQVVSTARGCQEQPFNSHLVENVVPFQGIQETPLEVASYPQREKPPESQGFRGLSL